MPADADRPMPTNPDLDDDERATLVSGAAGGDREQPLLHVAPREAPAGDPGEVRSAATTVAAVPVAQTGRDA